MVCNGVHCIPFGGLCQTVSYMTIFCAMTIFIFFLPPSPINSFFTNFWDGTWIMLVEMFNSLYWGNIPLQPHTKTFTKMILFQNILPWYSRPFCWFSLFCNKNNTFSQELCYALLRYKGFGHYISFSFLKERRWDVYRMLP
jgi:hypothetical protein